MSKTVISILALLLSCICNCQTDSVPDLRTRHFDLNISYNSSLIYPGITSGIEFPLQVKQKNSRFMKERFISGKLNWYHHPGFHDNLYLTAEWVLRRTRNKGLISEFSMGPGYSRTFLAGTTYKVNDNGSISVIKLAGYSYAMLTTGGGFGYDFSKKKNLPFSVVVKMNILAMFPYNSTIYLRPVIESGFRFSPSDLKCKVRKESFTTSGQK